MSDARQFCPRCGTDLGKNEGLAPPSGSSSRHALLCHSCFLEEFDLVAVPDELTLGVCTSCGAVRTNEQWEDIDEADYTDVAIEAVGDVLQVHQAATDVTWTVEPIQRGPHEIDLVCTVSARVDEEPVTEEHTVTIRISRETCSRCGQIAGDYYAGTVQVRAAGERTPTDAETDRAVEIAHEVVDAMRETGDRSAFVTEVIDRPEGADIRVSTNGIGAKISGRITEELGGKYDSSERLVTEDADGERVYRVAFAVRLPQFRSGDIVEAGDGEGPVLVRSGEHTIRGRRLASGEEIRLDAASLTRLGTAADAVETTLVAVEDDRAVQVLDPETAEAKTIPRPADFDDDQRTVHIFKGGSGTYIVPRPAATEASTS